MTAPFEIHGFCDERFRVIEEAFRKNFDEGLEVGSSLGVTWRGKMVVDLWGGWSNAKKTKRWRKNTIVPVNSVTKIALLLCVLRLIDQRRLRLDEPVCRYWPAFGQGGKDKVTVREFITHRGGVPGFVPPIRVRDLPDWKKMTAHIAAQPHRFDGKTVLCYHPVTYGFVLGELVRRIDGRMVSRYFRDEYARRIGADFHMGLSSMLQLLRVAEVIPPVNPPEQTGIFKEILDSTPIMTPEGQAALRSWRFVSATMPANLGFANGRSIARMCAIFALRGRLGWRRYLSKKMVDEVGREQIYDEDLYIGRIRWGLGFGLDSPDWPAPSRTSFHWGGAGGSWGVMDPTSQVSLGFAPNNHFAGAGAAQDPRLGRINQALRDVIARLPNVR